MIQNIKCNTCKKPLHNTDFWCSLRCSMRDENFWLTGEPLDGPDEKQAHVEQFNPSLI